MKNKLLITSALAGSLMAGSVAIAQTTITGDLALEYSALKKDTGNGLGSTRGFGRESQVNIQTKGKLNNGMDYAAGFALEFDGRGASNTTSATETPSISNENVYFDLIIGNTTLTAGLDHIQRNYNGTIPAVFNITEVMRAAGSSVTYVIGAGTSEAAGAGIMQKIPEAGLTLSAYYAPRSKDTGTEDVAASTSNLGSNSSYEIGLNGTDTFGIKGLTTTYFYNKAERGTSAYAGDVTGKSYGVAYNFGTFAIGADKFIDKNGIAAAADRNIMGEAGTAAERNTTRYGVSYAVDKNMTIALVKSSTDVSGGQTNGTETVKAVQVGYNFGPVALSASYAKFDDLIGASGVSVGDNGKLGQVRLSTKF